MLDFANDSRRVIEGFRKERKIENILHKKQDIEKVLQAIIEFQLPMEVIKESKLDESINGFLERCYNDKELAEIARKIEFAIKKLFSDPLQERDHDCIITEAGNSAKKSKLQNIEEDVIIIGEKYCRTFKRKSLKNKIKTPKNLSLMISVCREIIKMLRFVLLLLRFEKIEI